MIHTEQITEFDKIKVTAKIPDYYSQIVIVSVELRNTLQ